MDKNQQTVLINHDLGPHWGTMRRANAAAVVQWCNDNGITVFPGVMQETLKISMLDAAMNKQPFWIQARRIISIWLTVSTQL